MRSRVWPMLVVAAGLAGGCGTSQASGGAVRAATRPVSRSALVGRWETRRTCQGLVQALRNAGLLSLAPGVVADYFPGESPRQLSRRAHLCRGASPQDHSHFFTRGGQFGSLDQRGQQVDDGVYRLTGPGTLHIGNADTGATFHYEIAHSQLMLQPVLTQRMRAQALAHPLKFSPAGWAVSVAYGGRPWQRVTCDRC